MVVLLTILIGYTTLSDSFGDSIDVTDVLDSVFDPPLVGFGFTPFGTGPFGV